MNSLEILVDIRSRVFLAAGVALFLSVGACTQDPVSPDEPPTVSITFPPDNAVIGESVTVSADATDRRSVASVEFYVDDVVQHTDTSPPYEFLLDASGEELGSSHTLKARATDALGNVGTSSFVTVYCRWMPLIQDGDEPWETDLARAYARRTSTTVEFRIETNGYWLDPYDWSTGIMVGIYLDVDQSQGTGASVFTLEGDHPNDIGADYLAAVGAAYDTILMWDASDTAFWYHAGLEYLDLPYAGNSFEVGLALVDIGGDPGAIDVVMWEVDLGGSGYSWAPDVGHATVPIDCFYVGRTGRSAVAETHRRLTHSEGRLLFRGDRQ